MELILATKNNHKLDEFTRILSPLGIRILSQPQAGVDVDVIEDADSFEGNSLLKARAVCAASGRPAIADDSGLAVDALNGAPGVYSARYGGPELDDAGRYKLLLRNLEQIPAEQRTARFVSAIALVYPDGREYTFTGVCEGMIGDEPRGEHGFGYDPVFYVGGKSFSELTDAQKDAISHRGKALEKLCAFLKEEKGIRL